MTPSLQLHLLFAIYAYRAPHVLTMEGFSTLYMYQNEGVLCVCGDFNARVGCDSDYIKGTPDSISDHSILSWNIQPHASHFGGY